ncbi:hypothetical protein NE857_20765 [Nocardiopsis exhalans]|uniref:Uncharacterized protein n=1 Tax=Nocardiopsis exhalans TaxID=163604 RepID=A0ABY5D2V2_9ACTN|nr:hypothetical protein [Nocardiopsis exhalans]USY17755.1 hypothetical protein NE857_20765 [Nocardiopsis exhalans]
MTTYRVRVKRWERGWELHIDGVGVTQARRLTEAEDMARDYIAMALDIDDDVFTVVIEGIEVDSEVDALAERASQVQHEAERAQQEAVRMIDRTVAQLQRRGLNNREIARYLRISPQRVSQISARQKQSSI